VRSAGTIALVAPTRWNRGDAIGAGIPFDTGAHVTLETRMPVQKNQGATPPDIVGITSGNWQDTSKGEHIETLGAYLDVLSTLPIFRRVAEQTLLFLRLAPGKRVLDVGCGNGVLLPSLASVITPDGHVDAIDHAPQFVAAAQDRVKSAGITDLVTVREGDACHLPFPDATFDAVHCERVLMHLDDPNAVLREMRRVVKPGGWVVAAETDWEGMRIDHPDHQAMTLLHDRFCTRAVRNPGMGVTLQRRMFDIGLLHRDAVPVVEHRWTYGSLKQIGYDPTVGADELVAEGRLTRERIDDALAYLDMASANDSFWAYGLVVVAAGQVPA